MKGTAELSQHRKVVHIHIPKCGGTTVTQYLRRLLGAENVAHFGHRGQTAEFRRLAPAALEKYAAVGGHIPYPKLLAKLGAEPTYFAIVRDPFDLFVSYYQDVSTRESHPLHKDAASMAPLDFLEHVASKRILRSQCAYLAESESLDEAAALLDSGAIKAADLKSLRVFLQEIALFFDLDPVKLPHVNQSKKAPLEDAGSIRELIDRYYAADNALLSIVNSNSRARIW